MYVVKRDGRRETVLFDKISSRIQKLCWGLDRNFIDPPAITMKVISGLYPGITTVELDNLAAETAISMASIHIDYSTLATRIAVSNLQKETKQLFSDVITDLFNAVDSHSKCKTPLISEEVYQIVMKYAEKLNLTIQYERDYNYSYFGFKALEKSFLLRINGKVVESPQQMFMRVAIGIHKDDISSVLELYNLMSEKWFICSCSTLFYAGVPKMQLSSCFALTSIEDSIEGIYETLKRYAIISKNTAGIGLSVHNIRAKGTHIAGTGGSSNGLLPMLKLFNDTTCFIDECGNKHSTGCTIYLETWHADIFEFLSMKKSNKDTYHMNFALWIPNLFMERVEKNDIWSLMCPHESPGLSDVWGEKFEQLYKQYEEKLNYKFQIKAQTLWLKIIQCQIDTGFPYMLYKDTCNLKSNHQYLGTIKCSSLDADMMTYSSSNEVAVCSLASIALDRFVKEGYYDFQKLKEITKIITVTLNKIIDVSQYPLHETEVFSRRYRPIGISVQGLADAFILMRYPFDSEEAQKLNVQIFETIYYGALEASCELAHQFGSYETYNESPVSKGILQFDMWNVMPSNLWDWSLLKGKISRYGLRNSLLITLAPTHHADEILGNIESVCCITNNISTKHAQIGSFQVINNLLLKDLTDKGLWNEDVKNQLIENNGSIQNIDCIPDDLKLLYRTVWEIPQKVIIKMAADRGAFIDQSQSISIYFKDPNYGKMTSMHFYSWRAGLKTGMSKLHTPQSSLFNTKSPARSKIYDKQIKDESIYL
ncbi:ribonucleoside-diphosphate reductase large subunit-like [Centruroides sculpturatus]|uniref:ribonucleoside-diphosphate reductase large subunit-like n=1 Tax=Centruroides sculpturatus TaxID=218467 RepID=UPI000C6E7017|nr:ribonucleoside-diphosphate reductase large subunit-like [Centruroides sculpturatus]